MADQESLYIQMIKKNTFQKLFTRASFAGLLLTAGASAAFAQTSGTLTSTATAYNYSTAPWVLTGTGTYPDGGGVATFNPTTGATPGTVAGVTTVTVNVSPTLSGVTYNSPFSYTLAAGTGTSIIASVSGLTLNAQLTAANTPTLFQLANTFSSPISGGGTAGLTKTGVGTVNLTGANTYTGGMHINGGLLEIGSTAAVGDSVFGDASGGISFNGGALFTNVTGGLTDGRAIFIDTGGATIYTNTAAAFNGVISGTGSLTNAGFANVALTLGGANTYTGATIDRQNVSNTVLNGNGSILATSSLDLTGTFTLDNTATNLTNRVSDTAPVTIRGVSFVETGNASATSSETIGTVTAASSFNTFLVTPGGGTTTPQANSLTMASLTRQNNSTFDFRGAGLGGTPGAGVANIYATAAPALSGGSGAAGTTTQSILPYAIGNSTTSVLNTAAGLVGSSLVTYGATGFRPLATTEYATAFGGNLTDNVRITDGTTQSPVAAIANSVLLAPATAAASALTGTITVTSGAFLYSPTTDVAGTVAANLNFGPAEGIVTNTSALTLSGATAGTGGVTYTTPSTPTSPVAANLTLTGASTYTGNSTINAGVVGISGTVAAAGNASVFGTSGTVVLAGGVNYTSLFATAVTTLNRDLSVIGTGTNYLASSGSGYTFTLGGNVNLSNNLYIYGNSNTAASAFIFNGTVSGTSQIIDTGLGYEILNGNNTYSGGTTIGASSTFVAGSNTAFGTGPIYVTGSTANLSGTGTTATTLANNLFLSGTTGFVGTAPLSFTGGVNLNGARTLTVSNTALTTFSGVVANGSITKGGTGPLALNSPTGNTFTGGFVNTGAAATASAIYATNTSGSAFGTGAVSVGGASATGFSTLAGSFSTSGAATIGGRLSPGYTPANLTAATAGQGAIGTETFGTTLTLSSGTTSSLYLEVGSSNNFDKIVVAQALTLAGTVNLATINGYAVQVGDTFKFLTFGSLTAGTFTINSAGVTLAAGVTLDTSTFGVDGTVRAVPEPGTFTLLGAGLLGLFGFMRSRRRANAACCA